MTCTCIRLNCVHPKGECEEPPTYRGGICLTCRYYREPFKKCDLCGEPERVEDIVAGRICLTCAEGITWSTNARRASISVKVEE